jgi:uncharacterized phiE125 gp8 family phage protein
MIPIPVEGPAVEPVSLEEMRAHLRLDHDREDALVTGLVKAARLMVEAASGRVLVDQRWRVVLDAWTPGRTPALPVSPLLSVERVAVLDRSGTAVTVPADAYRVEALSDPPRIAAGPSVPDPGVGRNGILVDLRAGYGSAPEDVPSPLRLAVRIQAAHWFENRGDVAGEQSMTPQALALVAPFRRARL